MLSCANITSRTESRRTLLDIEAARAHRFAPDWAEASIVRPGCLGVKIFTNGKVNLGTLAEKIDWTPFFHAWEMKGVYPKILNDPAKGAEATKLYEDAQAMLADIVANSRLSARAVIGLFPANSQGDDVLLYANDERKSGVDNIPHAAPANRSRGITSMY